ncbi:hypothetical protein TBLA_0A00440 [Henningerozyma blattae CBS 6284]|uniref:Uncharacterized protein n=1 Tax=Henningerozyma blattae (strain ATCC 34711 / CBS 6284 / DSM 70876 / NBRC 10599 / NRRL Y-10934 / UCD 77-7) TaxID=1071380 RepID=I2GUP2_HENB6|nr:hypothetical protein TBLA_0A00440 [Tetrapisispora blattae CBS 6284]CCH57844.1 hypothetical protein TBLA_0A00440 [Tetrapisispora blattae CBS 6284]
MDNNITSTIPNNIATKPLSKDNEVKSANKSPISPSSTESKFDFISDLKSNLTAASIAKPNSIINTKLDQVAYSNSISPTNIMMSTEKDTISHDKDSIHSSSSSSSSSVIDKEPTSMEPNKIASSIELTTDSETTNRPDTITTSASKRSIEMEKIGMLCVSPGLQLNKMNNKMLSTLKLSESIEKNQKLTISRLSPTTTTGMIIPSNSSLNSTPTNTSNNSSSTTSPDTDKLSTKNNNNGKKRKNSMDYLSNHEGVYLINKSSVPTSTAATPVTVTSINSSSSSTSTASSSSSSFKRSLKRKKIPSPLNLNNNSNMHPFHMNNNPTTMPNPMDYPRSAPPNTTIHNINPNLNKINLKKPRVQYMGREEHRQMMNIPRFPSQQYNNPYSPRNINYRMKPPYPYSFQSSYSDFIPVQTGSPSVCYNNNQMMQQQLQQQQQQQQQQSHNMYMQLSYPNMYYNQLPTALAANNYSKTAMTPFTTNYHPHTPQSFYHNRYPAFKQHKNTVISQVQNSKSQSVSNKYNGNIKNTNDGSRNNSSNTTSSNTNNSSNNDDNDEDEDPQLALEDDDMGKDDETSYNNSTTQKQTLKKNYLQTSSTENSSSNTYNRDNNLEITANNLNFGEIHINGDIFSFQFLKNSASNNTKKPSSNKNNTGNVGLKNNALDKKMFMSICDKIWDESLVLNKKR